MVTFTVFGRATRQPGTYRSATGTIPLGIDSVGISDTMTDAVASDVDNSFILTLYVSPTGLDGSWVAVFREQWQGGTHFDKTTQTTVPNHIRMQWADDRLRSGQWLSWFAMGEIDQPVRMAAGFNIVVYNADEAPAP